MTTAEPSTSEKFNSAEFRRALGSFATGVTIITARDADGVPQGLTVNSFNSVSLNPPLVLWSLSTRSSSLRTFEAATHWAVHVLAADQHPLSAKFALRGRDKFAGIDTERGLGDVPLLRGCTARFQCRTAFTYEGGDHVIFIGEVLSFDRKDAAPLVFHGGRYAHATPHDSQGTRAGVEHIPENFSNDFLGHQIGRVYSQLFTLIRPRLAEAGLGEADFRLISALSLQPGLEVVEIDAAMAGPVDMPGDNRSSRATLNSLVLRGLAKLSAESETYELTEAGRSQALTLMAAARSVEAQALERLEAGQAAVLKSLLARLLDIS